MQANACECERGRVRSNAEKIGGDDAREFKPIAVLCRKPIRELNSEFGSRLGPSVHHRVFRFSRFVSSICGASRSRIPWSRTVRPSPSSTRVLRRYPGSLRERDPRIARIHQFQSSQMPALRRIQCQGERMRRHRGHTSISPMRVFHRALMCTCSPRRESSPQRPAGRSPHP